MMGRRSIARCAPWVKLALTTIKGYLDYGMFAPTQLAAATLTVRQQDRAGLPVTGSTM